jgi:hypothetical protein
MPQSPLERPIVSLNPFGGLNATSDVTQVDAQHAVGMQNVVPFRKFGSYATTQGRTYFTNPAGSGMPALGGAMIQFVTNPGNLWYLSYNTDGNLYAWQYGSMGAQIYTGLAGNQIGKFCVSQQWAFFSDPLDIPVKIDTSFNVTYWGIAYPASAPTLAGATGGNLTVGGAYAYLVTFGNSVMESSAGPISSFLTLAGGTPSTANLALTGTANSGDYLSIILISGSIRYYTISSPPLSSGETAGAALAALVEAFVSANNLTGGNAPYGAANFQLTSSGASATMSDLNGFASGTTYGGATWVLVSYSSSGGSGNISVAGGSSADFSFSGGTQPQQTIDLSAIPVSTDPQVSERNIYRIGGSQSQFQLVGTINDNTTTTYTDTLADADITGQTLVPHRDPPAQFVDIVTYQDRVWGFGYSNPGDSGGLANAPYTQSDVWYSQYAEPWAFDNTNQVLPCGRNTGDDVLVGGCATPSMLLALKNKSTWAIYGTSQADYISMPVFGIGCASKRSIVSAYGLGFWISNEAIVYMFDGSYPIDISTMSPSNSSVKGILDGLSASDLSQSVGLVAKQCYIISFPTKGFTLGYYIPNQTWYQLSFATDAAYSDTEGTALGTIVGTGNIVQWFNAETDLGDPISSYYESGIFNQDQVTSAYEARHVVISSIGNIVGTAYLTITANPGGIDENTQTIIASLQSNRIVLSLPKGLIGSQFQLKVAVPSSGQETIINSVTLFATPKRMLTAAST